LVQCTKFYTIAEQVSQFAKQMLQSKCHAAVCVCPTSRNRQPFPVGILNSLTDSIFLLSG
jgi:hypothetical protein